MLTVDDAVFADAVRVFWQGRAAQAERQESSGTSDRGQRAAVTGGKQCDGFLQAITDLAVQAGVPAEQIHRRRTAVPGYYRATKNWDLLVVDGPHLRAAIEIKSQVGPSFGNNVNNRAEEAVGSAVDVWTAYRERAYGTTRPWLGYLFVLEAGEGTTRPVGVDEPFFPVFPEFQGASYAQRYEALCRRLVLERQYDAACLILTSRDHVDQPRNYREPAADLSARNFLISLLARLVPSVR